MGTVDWRKFNLVLTLVNSVLALACIALWVVAWLGGFIGNTAFIGHVSMLALVMAAVSTAAGALAAWRSDVPTPKQDDE